MERESKMPLSFHDWEQLCFLQQDKEPEIVIESIEEAAAVSQEEHPEEEIPEKNEALEKIRNLCRVCTNQGFIKISSTLTPKLFTTKPSGDMRPWQVPIAKILEEVSGESVRKYEFHNNRKITIRVFFLFRFKSTTTSRSSFVSIVSVIFNTLTLCDLKFNPTRQVLKRCFKLATIHH